MNAAPIEQLDVLIVGAGISGIAAARHLATAHPAKSFAVLEARGATGGTWDLFRYPGVRSDSDLHTFGYEFKPWRDEEAIADAPRILEYLRSTVTESNLDDHIRLHHQVIRADWSSTAARWLVEARRTTTGEAVRISARWIFSATGYYRYDEGYSPEFLGRADFRGELVHPQHWPGDLDCVGKRVIVIGSGATAVTLVPALTQTAEHVTMLQRTPTYIVPLPRKDAIANLLRRLLDEKRAYALVRRKNIAQQRLIWRFCHRFPGAARSLIRWSNARLLPDGFPVDEHFNPPYAPWDQRLCVVPDGDLFKAISAGRASVVTDRVARFTETGVLLKSGRELNADVIVTATGLNLQVVGGIQLSVDGRKVSYPDTIAYRGMMLSGVPNFAVAVGYTNASWTLKIGLVCEYFCRLLAHMDATRQDAVWAVADPDMPTRPLLDFDAGYVQRSLAELPKQGVTAPWQMSMDYKADLKLLRNGAITDDFLRFSSATAQMSEPALTTGQGCQADLKSAYRCR